MSDGVEIAVHDLPSGRSPWCHAIVLHGNGLNSISYLPFAKLLAAFGIHVSLIDRRGHGASEGEPGWVDHDMQYSDDLHACMCHLAQHLPGLPQFILAHSAGSAIALKAFPKLATPPRGLAMLAPTFAHDPLMARERSLVYSHWRYGVKGRAGRVVLDNDRSKMSFRISTFLLARLFGIATRKSALVFHAININSPDYSYSSGAVAATMLENTETALEKVSCPVFLATGELDSVVNDSAVQLALPWMLSPHVPYSAYSYLGADHFTVLFRAMRDVVAWMRVTTESGSIA